MSAPVRIVIVDDQELVRVGLERIFSAEVDLTVVAACSSGSEALQAIETEVPDLVIMDVRMRGMSGIDAIRILRSGTEPIAATPVLVLTTFGEDEVLWGAIEAGASGFALKDADAAELLRAVRAVAAGAAWLDPVVTPRVLRAYRTTVLPLAREQRRADRLTDRERGVLELMATGSTNGEIAASLHVSQATVKSHVGAIFAKLGARDRAGAIVYAYQHGIVVPRDDFTNRPGADDVRNVDP